jgi:hypothetical protein
MIIMMDTIGADVNSIPVTAQKVAGYVTGSGIVPWSVSAWNRFPNAGHIRIKQTSGNGSILESDVIDVEQGAATVDDVITYVRTRINAGITWSTVYGTRSTLHATLHNLQTHMGTAFYGHVDCWLADWSLSQAEATAMLATTKTNNLVEGMSCRAIQFASPTSNPHTFVPGTHITLPNANVDLSVTQDEWYAHGSTWNLRK